MPLVHLALAEVKSLGNATNEIPGPVSILQKLILQDLELLLVFPLPALDIAVGLVVLSLLEECSDALVEVGVFEFIVSDVEWFVRRLLLDESLIANHGAGCAANCRALVVISRLLALVALIFALFFNLLWHLREGSGGRSLTYL
jgi:hypothetical protein